MRSLLLLLPLALAAQNYDIVMSGGRVPAFVLNSIVYRPPVGGDTIHPLRRLLDASRENPLQD